MRSGYIRLIAAVVLATWVCLPEIAAQDTGKVTRIWDGVFTTGQSARGRGEYDRVCSRCHSPELTGSERGPAIRGEEFRGDWENDTVGRLFIKIRDTMPQGNPGTLAEDTKVDILAYILEANGFPAGEVELEPDVAVLDAIGLQRRGVWDGVYTTDQADRGRTALLDNGCSGCHGAELEGDRGPALQGDGFIASWENSTLNQLLVKLRDTMPPLNAEQVRVSTKVDIIAHLLRANGFPAGAAELTSDPEALEGVRIVREGVDSAGPQNYTLVRVVGCLTPDPNGRWTLARATRPAATADDTPLPDAIDAARRAPLGTETFELVSLRPAYAADRHRGHRMEARGLLYMDPEHAELNLTSLEMVSSTCSDP